MSAKFKKGDEVVAVGALNSLNNGTRGTVDYTSGRAINVHLTYVPFASNLIAGEYFTFLEDSLSLAEDEKPPIISACEIKVGDEIQVTQVYRGIKVVHTGVVDHFGQLTYYTKENGIIFSKEWDAELRLIKAYEHPLESAVPGTRFEITYPSHKSSFEFVKYAQGFWNQEEFDKQGVLVGLLSFTEKQARRYFDQFNGKLKK